jgi:hypothetical protein
MKRDPTLDPVMRIVRNDKGKPTLIIDGVRYDYIGKFPDGELHFKAKIKPKKKAKRSSGGPKKDRESADGRTS